MKTTLIAFIALVTGVTGGYFMARNSPDDVRSGSPVEKRQQRREIAADKTDAAVKALRARIRDLERRLAESDRNEEPSREEQNVAHVETPQPVNWRDRMEKMKTDDPQRYQEITNRVARFRMHRARQAASKMEFLSSIDVSGMSAAAKRTHEELQQAIVDREELEIKLHDADLSDEERGALFAKMRETDGRLRRLNAAERDNLLLETAKGLGFGGAEAKEISATIKDVIDATSSWGHMPGFGGGRGRRGGNPR